MLVQLLDRKALIDEKSEHFHVAIAGSNVHGTKSALKMEQRCSAIDKHPNLQQKVSKRVIDKQEGEELTTNHIDVTALHGMENY